MTKKSMSGQPRMPVVEGRVKSILVNGERLPQINTRKWLALIQKAFIEFCKDFGFDSQGDFLANIERVDEEMKSLTFEGMNGGELTQLYDDNMPWMERRIKAGLEKTN